METQTAMVGGEPYEFVPMGTYVVRASGVCGGRPTFKYTRIEVAGVLSLLASGESMESIVLGYQGRIPREAILEGIDLAAQSLLRDLPALSFDASVVPAFDQTALAK